jgi:membrane protease YdiL (CAAX protease family)
MDKKSKTLREIIVFLALTVILSSLAYIPILQVGTITGGQSKFASFLMLAPGLAAVITYLVFEHSLRPIGWRPGKIPYLILGLVLPIVYCLFEYGLAWLTGRGKYNGQFPPNFPVFLVTMLFNGTLSAVLEEVAWRGFLVPQMIKLTSFTKTAIITGLIWAIWHYPLIIYSNIRSGNTPLPYSLVCFTIFVVGLSFAAAWLRLKSGSVWTAALLHGSHNAFMLHVFDVLTTDTGSTWLLLGEYGAVTAAIGLLLAILFWSLRTRLPATNQTRARKKLFEGRPTPAPSEEAAHVLQLKHDACQSTSLALTIY